MSVRTAIATLVALSVFVSPAFAHGQPEHGGQAVEVQDHQFELVVEPEAQGTHLDFYITDPKDKPVSTAMVKLQLSTPDGQKVSLLLKYAEGHYTGLLPGGAKGQYKVVALCDIGGKKLNSRFAFKR